MTRWCILLAFAVLAGCSTTETSRRADAGLSLPAMNTFANTPAAAPRMSNSIIARDFVELSFMLENGAPMPVFTRFEGPITVGFEGAVPASLDNDLTKLINRLRKEARIDISRAPGGTAPSARSPS